MRALQDVAVLAVQELLPVGDRALFHAVVKDLCQDSKEIIPGLYQAYSKVVYGHIPGAFLSKSAAQALRRGPRPARVRP